MIKYEQQWRRRVVSEKKHLDIKRNKLSAFMNNKESWRYLSDYDKLLLHRQLDAMNAYSNALAERIILFNPTKAAKPVREEPVKNHVVEG